MLKIFDFLKNKKADIILLSALFIISSVLAVILFLFKPTQSGLNVLISQDGNVIAQFPLESDTEYNISTNNGYNKLVISDGAAYIEDADCKGHDCISQGKISNSGESIICLPHKVVIYIE